MATLAPTPETRALEDALAALLSSSASGNALAREARVLSRAADDLEVAAVETHDTRVRRALMEQVDNARAAAAQARVQARTSALASKRSELLEELPRTVEKKSSAAQLAKEINESLRRTTAVVAEEVERSDAAGMVVDESSRRLRMTRDQHGRYGESLGGGRDTLKEIRNTERKANLVVGLSVVLFFAVAFYVARKKVANSNTATFIVRPATKIMFAPIRIGSSIFRFLFRNTVSGNAKQQPGTQSSASVEADAKEKAKRGREPPGLETQPDEPEDQAHGIHSPQAASDETTDELEHSDKVGKETSHSEDGPRAIREVMKNSEDEVSVHEDTPPRSSNSDVSMHDNVARDKESEKVTETTITKSTTLDVDAHSDATLSNQQDPDSRRNSADESVLADEAASKGIPANELSGDTVNDATEYSRHEEKLASQGNTQEDEMGSKAPTQEDAGDGNSTYDEASEESEEDNGTTHSRSDSEPGFGDPIQDILKDDDLQVSAKARKDRSGTVLDNMAEKYPRQNSRKEATPNADRITENAPMSKKVGSGIDKVDHEIEEGHLRNGEDAGFSTNLAAEEAVKSRDSVLPVQANESQPDRLDELSNVNEEKPIEISEKELSKGKERNILETSSKEHDVSANAPKIDKMETIGASAQDQNSQRVTPDEAMRADEHATKDMRKKELEGDAREDAAEDSEEKEETNGETNEEVGIERNSGEGDEEVYDIGARSIPSQDDGEDAIVGSTTQDMNTIAEDSGMQIQEGDFQSNIPDDSLQANESATKDMREKELSGVVDDGIWEGSHKERDAIGSYKGERDEIERQGKEESSTVMPDKIHATDEELRKNDASGETVENSDKTLEDLNASATDKHDEL